MGFITFQVNYDFFFFFFFQCWWDLWDNVTIPKALFLFLLSHLIRQHLRKGGIRTRIRGALELLSSCAVTTETTEPIDTEIIIGSVRFKEWYALERSSLLSHLFYFLQIAHLATKRKVKIRQAKIIKINRKRKVGVVDFVRYENEWNRLRTKTRKLSSEEFTESGTKEDDFNDLSLFLYNMSINASEKIFVTNLPLTLSWRFK